MRHSCTTTWTKITVLVAAVVMTSLGTFVMQPATGDEPAQEGRITTLLLTGGPVHDGKAIGDLVHAAMDKTGRFDITRVHDDLDALLADRIAPFKVVVFYWTLGEINDAQKRGLLNHIASGNGFVTFHSGADSFRGDPEYRALVGGYFLTHPHYRTYQVSVTQTPSPITSGIDEFMITDEQYILDYDPRVTVLANGLYQGRPMPVLWTKDWGKGRVFYNALGHDPKACEQETFQQLLIRGTLWAASQE
ncbi:MAG: ThuA domain-containing protein [Pirellulaceae bacterium]